MGIKCGGCSKADQPDINREMREEKLKMRGSLR